jgi:hypothetical protein
VRSSVIGCADSLTHVLHGRPCIRGLLDAPWAVGGGQLRPIYAGRTVGAAAVGAISLQLGSMGGLAPFGTKWIGGRP